MKNRVNLFDSEDDRRWGRRNRSGTTTNSLSQDNTNHLYTNLDDHISQTSRNNHVTKNKPIRWEEQ